MTTNADARRIATVLAEWWFGKLTSDEARKELRLMMSAAEARKMLKLKQNEELQAGGTKQ